MKAAMIAIFLTFSRIPGITPTHHRTVLVHRNLSWAR